MDFRKMVTHEQLPSFDSPEALWVIEKEGGLWL